MTLSTVPSYDGERIPDRDGRAVVLGAGVAGLLAARVLADAFEAVTVIERDPLPDVAEPRRGVPQGNHVHVLLEGGRAAIDDLCPGFSDDVTASGGVITSGTEFRIYVQGDTLRTDHQSLHLATRALYEHTVRRRVASLEGVEMRSGCQFVDYVADGESTAVEGVTIRNRESDRERLVADLVVDATGRTSRTPEWLETHGYDRPPVDEVEIDIGYASTFVERPPDDRRGVSLEAEAPRTRGAFLVPVEGDRWLVNLHGVHGDHPPTDPDGFEAFAATLPFPIVSEILSDHPMTDGDVAFYPFPSNRRYRYEKLDRFPDGLVVVGDAIASFNPVNGQGMSVAALEALLLHHALVKTGRDGLELEFFDDAAAVVDVAWNLSVGGDLAFSQTEGELPRGAAAYDWYVNRLIRRAHTDVRLADVLWSVFMLERPPSVLFRPRVVWRAFGPIPGRGEKRIRQATDP
ncbi:FAD-dependent monooxygenase [Natronobacterium texcoconense]|uniref:Dehydrogenase (Flavoprotein) n=1 Tax=Natronobacterium texcoconense TaxID=1095778 RepID=A0A1H1GJS7_NATTX|nr:FAD-dependent monooxygenase [Natronobacterium texcoconense]SDR13136.1 Dehydrogenase (flavoprotein) [Natronobacterium texcoconense]